MSIKCSESLPQPNVLGGCDATYAQTGDSLNLAEPSLGSLFPTETEIYLLPNGEVVVADLPAELAEMLKKLGITARTA